MIAAARLTLAPAPRAAYMEGERLARAGAAPTRSGPERSCRNEPRLGRCPASHLSTSQDIDAKEPLFTQGLGAVSGARTELVKAGQTRHLKIKDGRFYARIAVPAALPETIGKSEMMTPLSSALRSVIA